MTRAGVAVGAPNEAAAEAGRLVAEAGGNAVDAALAASLVTMVNEPGIVSPSSGAFVTVETDAGPITVDGWVEVPGRGRDPQAPVHAWDVTIAYGGHTTTTIGPGSVGTHGAIAAFGLAQQRWGVVPWREVVAPAVQVARDGFRLGSASRHYLGFVHDLVYGWDPTSRAALHDADGEPLGADALVVVPRLADSLTAVAEQGPAALYTGDLGHAVADAVTAAGGLLGRADLAAYEPVVRPSLAVRAGDWVFGTNPPPAVGGVCAAALLVILAGRTSALDGAADEAAGIDHLARTLHAVLRQRFDVLETAPDLAAAAASYLETLGVATGPDSEVLESGSTTHVSAVGADGSACAVTASSGYGSGLIAPGTGIWLNNCLGEQELTPGGRPRPGTRLLSNMAPTVGRRRDGTVLAIGSPGAGRIATALAQVLDGVVAGLDLETAIARPRAHVRLARDPDDPDARDTLDVEPGLVSGAEEVGGMPVHAYPGLDMYFGGVVAALATPDGALLAAGDPRRDGAVRVVR